MVTSAFEDWPLPTEQFDVVLAATAFAWVDPAVRLSKAAEALRSGGALATIATHHVAGGSEAFFVAVQDCYERFDPATPPGLRLPPANAIPHDKPDSSDRFGPTVFRRYEWESAYSTAEYLEVLSTYSGHRALPPATRDALLTCIGTLIEGHHNGHITKRYLNELRVAHRIR